MNARQVLCSGVAALALSIAFAAQPPSASAQANAPAVRVKSTSIGGVVRSANGPEAGVWVIAETRDLPTRYIKIVVTDDQGRYVIPDLPPASYAVWARGYGLVDGPKIKASPGKVVNLKAMIAPDERAAAKYYPAIYWYSMMKVPAKNEFPLGPIQTQETWMNLVKTNGCVTCHQLGNLATRQIPSSLGHFDSGADAWERRIQSGQASGNMVNTIGSMDTARALAMFGDWTDRVKKGELPFAKPQRPQGVERNIVVTQWDWASATTYLHDEIATDKRNPTVNAYGLLYGSPENSTDNVPILDPVKATTATVRAPVRDANTPNTKDDPSFAPSPYWGDKPIWESQGVIHNPMFDGQGRVWFTERIRAAANNPDFCKAGSEHPSAKLTPMTTSGRQLSFYDPKANKWSLIDTCFSTLHLQFDANDVLWAGGFGNTLGWLDTKKYLATGDVAGSQGWTALIVDNNGNGKRDEGYTEIGQPTDPAKDARVNMIFYSTSPSPSDGAIWGASQSNGYIVRLVPGASPPATALTEVYRLPAEGFGIRGGDVDTKGVFWAGLAGGQFASFDRSKCKGPLNGPGAASGTLCPEGWTMYPFPGPNFPGMPENASSESSYYTWVDQHDTFGLGKDVPIATGNQNESLLALKDGKFVQLRVPYPMGFFAKGMDGRIDDPNGGWKGRGLWSTYGNRTPQHLEGPDNKPKVVNFQLRPDPLAQ